MNHRPPTALKLAIVAAGVTQRDLARVVGIDDAQMSRIVHGLRVKTELQARIADALGLPVEQVFPTADSEREAA